MLSIVALIMEPRIEKAVRNHEEEDQEKFHILLDLPNELIVKILRYLTLNDLDIAFRELQYETSNFCYLHITLPHIFATFADCGWKFYNAQI